MRFVAKGFPTFLHSHALNHCELTSELGTILKGF